MSIFNTIRNIASRTDNANIDCKMKAFQSGNDFTSDMSVETAYSDQMKAFVSYKIAFYIFGSRSREIIISIPNVCIYMVQYGLSKVS